jgi:RNA polymerase sigma-70 factor (ECF subfamily)
VEEIGRPGRLCEKELMSQPIEHVRGDIVALLPRLRRFARTLARNPHDADDLVQVAIERGLAHYEQLRADSSVAAWMFGIVEGRARARRARLFAPEEAGANIGDPAADQQGDALSIEAALARLPEEQRLAIALVLVEGLSYKEAAAVMEVPMGTLTSRLARAREALQGMLTGAPGEAR